MFGMLKVRFNGKRLMLYAALLVAFLFGMTWNVEWERPYYEASGFIAIEQRLLHVEFRYTWGGLGMNYHTSWDVYRKERPHYNRTAEHPG